jgi:DNA-directed RNA polymerase specialized sigma24 family protein
MSMKQQATKERIANWARWARGGAPVASSRNLTGTGNVCDRMRTAAEGLLYTSSSRDQLDGDDAARVEQAWKRLTPMHRELLRWHHIRNANPQMICRRLGIKPRPTSIFDIELARAEAELARVLAQHASETAAFSQRIAHARESAR